MGAVTIDLRSAIFDHGVTEFDVSCIMSEVKFIVPKVFTPVVPT